MRSSKAHQFLSVPIAVAQPYAWLVPIRKLHPCRFQGLFDYGKCCPTGLSFSGLKLADGHNTNSRGIRKLLLTPIDEAPGCSALGRCKHH
jgi:hypothetical protein